MPVSYELGSSQVILRIRVKSVQVKMFSMKIKSH